MDDALIDLPDVKAEVHAVFLAYEEALLRNDHAALNGWFWPSPSAVRYGLAEHSYGIDEIREGRARSARVSPDRKLQRVAVAAFGRDLATVSAEFGTPGSPQAGRQTQTWVRFNSGWKIVAAHVSVVDAATLSR